ncbi:hypothetical protein Ancab_015903 [Ancistrocladus abbreviatus]
MNRENELQSPRTPSGEALTEEQRARISQKFRAAKALLARKKPRLSINPPHSCPPKWDTSTTDTSLPMRVSTMDRVPLKEVHTNIDSPFHSMGSRSCDDRYDRVTSLERSYIDRAHGNSSTMITGLLFESESSHASFCTPLRESECCRVCESSSLHSVLDEDLDECVLQEIDALCEDKSTEKLNREWVSTDEGVKRELGDGSNRESDSNTESASVSNFEKPRGILVNDSEFQEEDVKNEEISGMPEAYLKYILSLNDDQREAACSDISKPLMVLAGPGSGKTSTMVGRILMLLKEGIGPSHILAMTFTTAAASEMRDRIGAVAGKETAKELNVSTFHSFSLQLCRLHAEKLGRSSDFLIYGHGQQRRAVVEALRLLENGKQEECLDIGKLNESSHDIGSLANFKDRSKKWQKFVTQGVIAGTLVCCPEIFDAAFTRVMSGLFGNLWGLLAVFVGFAVDKIHVLLDKKWGNVLWMENDCFRVFIKDILTLYFTLAPMSDAGNFNLYISGKAKASGKTPEECRRKGDNIGATILSNYNDILRSCNALDYHDLISGSVKLLTNHPEVFKECQESWKAVIVDEFQDTSAMQYGFLKLLASHGCITVVGDDDQSIFSFNGADISGFDSFRKDFPDLKEIRLKRNYRSTRCIVEAALSLIQNNMKRCQLKKVLTDNSSGAKITVKECHNEDAQCAFVTDKILEAIANHSETKCSFGNISILYRRQVSGRVFQTAFRSRKIPFNVHGVAFYRKEVIKAVISMLKTTLPGCNDGPFRQVFKTLLPFSKEEKKRGLLELVMPLFHFQWLILVFKVIDHVDKVSTIQKCSFISAASDIFNAKISGTFKRSQLSHGRKVLITLEMISKLVHREQSISAVITSVANLLPQRYLLEQRAIVDVEDGKLLNEDNDLRSVLDYLLDDVTDFLSAKFVPSEPGMNDSMGGKGCINALRAFIDYLSEREKENFRARRRDNEDSVTLTTIHQSKGLEWDIVFIVKVNESEIPLLHEHNGVMKESGNSIEEERRLLYVGMTRARKKLFLLHVLMDSNWQMLQPSRFLKEIPLHLQEVQEESWSNYENTISRGDEKGGEQITVHSLKEMQHPDEGKMVCGHQMDELSKMPTDAGVNNGNSFLRRFGTDDRGFVSHIFHQWARKPAFRDPKRLLDKVGYAIDERLRIKKNKQKDLLRALKSCLRYDDALQFAEYVLRWEQIPPDKRAHLMREKQEHFQKLRMESAMNSSAPTSKQIAFLRNLGCTVVPESRLHASRLIEQYKSV